MVLKVAEEDRVSEDNERKEAIKKNKKAILEVWRKVMLNITVKQKVAIN